MADNVVNNMGVTNAAPEAAPTNASTEAQTAEQTTQTEQSAKSPAQKEVQKKVEQKLRKLKLKVDGQEYEEEFDPNDDAYLTRQFQMAKAAQKRMSEFSQLQKEVRSFVEALKKDPRKVLTDPTIGLDVKKFAAEILEEEIQNSKKSPDQLAREKLERELKDLKEQRDNEKKENSAKELSRLQEQAYERYDIAISNAIEKTDLPKSPYVLGKITDLMILAVQNGLDISADDIMPVVREDIANDLKQMFAVMPEEAIERIVGKDVLTKIRKKNISKVKSAAAPTPLKSSIRDVGATKKETKVEDLPKKNFKQFFGV